MSDALLLVRSTVDALIATSLVRRLNKEGYRVHCMSDTNIVELFRFSDCRSDTLGQPRCGYDVAINLSPSISAADIMDKVKAKDKLGFGRNRENILFYNDGADLLYRARVIGIPTDANLFQLIFGVAKLAWQGEGYEVGYFPRNKTKKCPGVAIRDTRIRKYVNENLKAKRIWQVPFKQNVLKQLDEINRCNSIVTDDETVMHASLALRKEVEFLLRRNPTYRQEMFKSGNYHVIEM